MKVEGYYRNPTVGKKRIVFSADDDLWYVPLKGGKAERLTAGTGEASEPALSPDENWIAFTSTNEGHGEVYLMPSEGGEAERLTFISEGAIVVGWTSQGEVLYSTNKNNPFRTRTLFKINPKTRMSQKIPCGPANFISYNPQGEGAVIQRHGYGYVSWKRYRGGTAGELWIDRSGSGNFQKLISVKGNALRPLWIEGRIYFISDHEGHGNVYSCTPEGKNLKRHTSHEDFFVRGLCYKDGKFAYTAGGDIYTFSLKDKKPEKVNFDFVSSYTQRSRKFTDPTSFLSFYALNKSGNELSIITRGRPFSFFNWEGSVYQYGERDGIRYKSSTWLFDQKRLLIVSGLEEEDQFEIHKLHSFDAPRILKKMNLGRILSIKASPVRDEAIFTNHRCELFHVNLKTERLHKIDKSHYGDIRGLDWSPDGKWIVYDYALSDRLRAIKLCEIKGFKTHTITRPILEDFSPSFDPEGKYIYFLSKRTFAPSYDNLQFEMGFPKGTKPYLILLDKTHSSPFIPLPKEKEEKPQKKEGKKPASPKPIKIDLKGIEDRIVEFPVEVGAYSNIQGIPGKVLYLSHPLQNLTESNGEEISSHASIKCYDFTAQKEDSLIPKVGYFLLSGDRQWLCYYSAKRLRVVKAGEKPQDNDPSYRKGGWIDLNRVKVSVNPPKEWAQIFDEVWRLQKDFFWTEDMSKIDWDSIYKCYHPLLKRVATRGDLTDLIAEMHGELGTSHAYVFGGDYRTPPIYPLGNLGADFIYDKTQKAYKISNLSKGDPWSPSHTSPLSSPGSGIKEGDYVLAVNGQRVDEKTSPEMLLVNQAQNIVSLLVKSGKNTARNVLVKALSTQIPARYRDWVEKNRAYVHKTTKGRIGYIHIPDMWVQGFAEFHRGFLAELNREGLVIDVRYNGGGNISPLLLEKLNRKRLGYDQTRWYGALPYPSESPMGPMVALINEYAGSDGDIFSHSFRTLKLGPLIGKRTWGGVVGIWPRHGLVDGGITTQPEFSFWFYDVGWAIENYGVDPDIEVEIKPQDYEKEADPQLDRGIKEVLAILKASSPAKPFSTAKPNLAPPSLKIRS